ncbi:MAG: cytochrome c1 [Sphingomonadaceae bacterium]
MIRLIAILVGLGFTVVVGWSFGVGAWTAATAGLGEKGAEYTFYKKPREPKEGFSFAGPLGRYDEAQLQRGYQVYKEVCASCHSLKFVHFRDLAALGYSEGQVKALAAEWTVPGIDPDTGESINRPGMPTDTFPSPYENKIAAAAANNNAIPPDLSLMAKARPDGSNYIYSLLTGYGEIPAELKQQFPKFETGVGLHFNQYFPNLNIAMAQPIVVDGQVTYAEGAPEATVSQMAQDVAAFLTWTAEPKLEDRKQTGFAVLIFLLFATVLAYLSKQQVWSALKRRNDA